MTLILENIMDLSLDLSTGYKRLYCLPGVCDEWKMLLGSSR